MSEDGLFDHDAVIRRVYSDAVCNLGAGSALLLQLAHPGIAQGVHDHSAYDTRPLDRLFGTIRAMNSVVFGSREEAEAVGDAIFRVHTHVNGPGYDALDPELLCWVNATLLGTAVRLYQRMIRPLTPAELDEFVADSRTVGAIFRCPVDAQPASWDAFDGYWQSTIDTLVVTDTARRVARSLLSGRGFPARPVWSPALAAARAVTAATLPSRIRRDYGLPWRRSDRAMARVVLGSAGTVLPRVPERWRQLGPELMRARLLPTG
jgi:uncharacterized protein (DUF2236 family)